MTDEAFNAADPAVVKARQMTAKQRREQAEADWRWMVADARGCRIELTGILEGSVLGSRELLRRALENVVRNAIRYSPEQEKIAICVSEVDHCAVIVVRDHGPGVPPEELAALFRPFFRGSNAPRADGHGLGLAIVQRVAKAHGGVVHAENAAGGGLDVQLLLPLAADGE